MQNVNNVLRFLKFVWNRRERETDANPEVATDKEGIHIILTVLYLEMCFDNKNLK